MWIPGPDMNLPTEYRREGTRIGDVGILYCSKGFSFLFNIFLAADHPINEGRVPFGFEPLHLSNLRDKPQQHVVLGPKSYLTSTSVKTSNDVDSFGLIFETSAAEGAVLIMPDGAVTEDLMCHKSIKKYLAKNAETWYEFVSEVWGREVDNGDIRLVIGSDKVSNWGIATSACSVGEQVRLEFKNVGDVSYTWLCAGSGSGRVGPCDREMQGIRQEADLSGPLQNQCVFLRTLNFDLSGECWNDLMNHRIRPSDHFSDSSSPGDSRSGHQGGRGAPGPGRGSLNPGESRSTSGDINFYATQFGLSVIHPSNSINKILLEKYPKALIAMTEDADWMSVLTNEDVELPKADELCTRLLTIREVYEEDGIVTFKPKKEIVTFKPEEDTNSSLNVGSEMHVYNSDVVMDPFFMHPTELLAHPPKQAEAFHNLLIQYHAYSCKLETLLDHFIQTYALPQSKDFRLERPKDPNELLGLSLSLGEFHLEEEDTVECDDPKNPTNILLWHDLPTLVEGYYGISSPFRFRSDPLPVPSRFPAIAKDPDVTYVLMIRDDTNFNPHFDWSRYLPSAVALDRGSHDRALDVLFRYCTSFCLCIIPDLFLKAMYCVLSVPRSQEPPRVAHYSPMLHNVIVALALVFLDDPRFRDLKTRQYFIDTAKSHMEAECQKPTLAVVQALSFLGTYYGSQGDQGLGFMYFGISAQVAQALGLSLDCSDYVKRGIMKHSDQIDRNWTTWSIFTSDVCWSLYVGRDSATSLPDDDFPLPYIDTTSDEMPVSYGNLAPQPNHTTKTFHANAELFIIARDILEVNNTLSKTKARPVVAFDRVHYVDTRLTDWCESLPSDLQLTAEVRSKASPHKLLLHLSYWWLSILLHRPLFHSCISKKAGQQIDHVKLCIRAADNIMEILKMWQDLFGLRFCPITLIQIVFSAGSVYLLLAVQACSAVPVAKKKVDHAITQQKLVVEYLHEIGRSWPGANEVAGILKILVQKKLLPLLDAMPVRDGEDVPSPPSRNRKRDMGTDPLRRIR